VRNTDTKLFVEIILKRLFYQQQAFDCGKNVVFSSNAKIKSESSPRLIFVLIQFVLTSIQIPGSLLQYSN
jgi:hypothetical protein